MIFIKKSLLIAFLCAIFIPFISFQDEKMNDEIVSCFLNGNSKKLSGYFNQNIEIAIPENKNIYSKAQAQQIIAKFFSENPAESFNILSTSTNDDAINMIGMMTTKQSSSYRVYIVLKKTNGKDVIHLLKIEKRQTK